MHSSFLSVDVKSFFILTIMLGKTMINILWQWYIFSLKLQDFPDGAENNVIHMLNNRNVTG